MQVAREPPEHVGRKDGLHETLQQQVMGHSVKGQCLRPVEMESGGGV